MKIRTLLVVCVVVMLALNAGRTLWLLRSFGKLTAEHHHRAAQEYETDAALTRVAALAADLETGVRGFQLTGDASFRRPYDDAARDRDEALAHLGALVSGEPRARAAAERAREHLRLWDQEIAAPLLAMPTGGDGSALTVEGKQRMDEVRADLLEIRRGVDARRTASAGSFDAYEQGLQRDAFRVMAVTLPAILAMWLLISRAVERPLATLAEHAQRVTLGELGPIEVRGVFEIRALATAWNRMVEGLALDRREAALAIETRATLALALANQKARLETAFLALTDAVLLLDPEGVVELANPAATQLLGPEVVGSHIDAIGQRARKSMPDGAIIPREQTISAACLVRREPLRNVARAMISATGESRTVCISAAPIPGPERVQGAVVAIRDVTEEHALRDTLAQANEALRSRNEALTGREEELRAQSVELASKQTELTRSNADLARASRLKSDFLANMSHELRTPLNAVIGFSDLLLSGDYGPLDPKQRAAVKDVLNAGEQQLTLINDILDVSKIEAGRVELRALPVDLADAVAQALTLLAGAARERAITIVNLIPRAQHFIRADPNRLRQILNNLLSNAVKFTHDRGTVTLDASTSSGRVRVTVADTGIGIAAEDAPRLFTAFSQLDSGYARRFQGTGLGLSICKKLVELMGGEIGFTSEFRKGSTFFFTLPAAPAQADAAEARPVVAARAPQRTVSAHPTVLLVEDQAAEDSAVEGRLVREGYRVARAHDPEQALAMVSELRPQLFVVDLALPGQTSLALIERIRALADHERTPIAVLSANALDSEDRARLTHWVQLIARREDASDAAFFAELRKLTPPRPRLLLIDDSEMNRKVIRAMLQGFPLEVIEAVDAASGLAAARAQAPDVILMDIQLPGMDGLTATLQLKAAPETRSIPVIAVTAHAMAGDPERALEAGCLAYVSKPISRKRLNEALDLALGGSAWRDEPAAP